MKNIWEVWTKALSEAECDDIVARAQRYPVKLGTISKDSTESQVEDTSFRSSDIRWLDAKAESAIVERVMGFVHASNRKNFGINIVAPYDIQFTEYHATAQGKYDWHQDVVLAANGPFDRKLSFVVQLSHPEDYEGGEFEFFRMPNPGELFRPRGSLLIFPSFYYHRVMPVSSGTRRSLVSWVEGPRWQ